MMVNHSIGRNGLRLQRVETRCYIDKTRLRGFELINYQLNLFILWGIFGATGLKPLLHKQNPPALV